MMTWAIIIIYWIPIILGLFSIKLIKFNIYDEYDKKVKLPIILYLLGIISLFIPIFGWIATIFIISFIISLIREDNYKIKHWLFKEI